MPQQQTQPNDEAQRERDEQILRARMKIIRRTLLVLLGKGGVGKSTVAANLAVSRAFVDIAQVLLGHQTSVHGVVSVDKESEEITA